MDVILDSNQYISDYRLASNKFTNLFDYLRRTKSALVIPHVVKEEVLATQTRNLKQASGLLANGWSEMNRILQKRLEDRPLIDFDIERERLIEKLRNPARGVKVEFDVPLHGVSINEVIRRGAHRIPPANADGEELRDVVLWLFALDYAKSTKQQVAFVSRENGFFGKEGVRPEIAEECKSLVKPYKELEEFNRENALKVREAKPHMLTGVDLRPVEHQARQFLISALATTPNWSQAEVKELVVKSLEFYSGNLYELSDKSTFVEVKLKGVANSDVERVGYVNPLSERAALNQKISVYLSRTAPSSLADESAPPVMTHRVGEWLWRDQPGVPSSVRQYTLQLNFRIDVSFRRLEGEVQDLEVDYFNLSDISLLHEED